MLRDYTKPYQKDWEDSDVLRCHIPRELKLKLKARLDAEGITLSQWVIKQIADYLKI